jgi:hypothetical protein
MLKPYQKGKNRIEPLWNLIMDYTKIKEQKKILLSFQVLNVHKIITYSAIENTLLNGFSFTEKATSPLK